ncbi:MAG: hypothetical protein IKK89_11010 [Alistipes sp.]|nr:hypothetical protein [Alistipes sp.]
MVVDFSKLDLQEQPVLILKNTAGVPIGTLGSAMNITADIKYNEASVLEFEVPAQVDGVDTPHYDAVIGMRIIELQDIGQFILINPKEVGDGVKKIKYCKAYSLEYEFTFKKLSLASSTYNFWNPVTPDSTLMQIILELMPSWSLGYIDSELVGKYRTFEVSDENLYNFIKGTIQESYNCIFDFDTMTRRINVKSAKSTVPTNPVYISNGNLAEEITVEENTENIVTRLDVNGADGVTIRDVNPMGTNQIINLDYFMNTDNFDTALIEKYWSWKDTYKNYQQQYYNLSVEYALQIMRKTTEQAALVELEHEMTSLENQQAVIIQAIASNLEQQSSLNAINRQISSKQSEIKAKKAEIEDIEADAAAVYAQLVEINKLTKFESFFTKEEYLQLDRYIKDDSVSESSFVVQTTDSYTDEDVGNSIANKKISISGASISKVTNAQKKDIYDIKGGKVTSDFIDAEIISAAFERATDNSFVMTAYLGAGTTGDTRFPKGCFSITGKVSSVSHDLTADSEAPDMMNGTKLSVTIASGYLYFTRNTSEYEKRAVAWDLFEYGNEILTKISQPAYTFSITSSNFLGIDEFVKFKNKLRHGEKIYVGISEDETLAPICIGLKFEFASPDSLSLEFSDTYVSSDSSFLLADLLEQSVSMGKSVDLNKYSYSAFMDSGASTKVKDFMTTALDVSKNAIMSSKEQAISWGDSGIRLRKWSDAAHTEYEPKQVWLNNNSILMTSNNWATAELAIGNFYDENLGDCWGIVAPNIVGTLLAGSNLVIESAKQDGGVAVFKMDAEGCVLHNSTFSVTSDNTNSHILIDPEHGFMIGKYPLIKADGTIDNSKKLFYADTKGNLTLVGTIYASAGEFTGHITATSGYIGQPSQGWTISSSAIYNGKSSYSGTAQGIYIGTDGISLGNASNYIRASKSGYLYANNVSISGHITATSGYIGGCEIENGTLKVGNANITSLNASKITAGTMSADRISGGSIDASDVTITNLNASNITSGTINGNNINVTNLSASNIKSGTLNCNNITVTNLRADSITVGKISASQINGLPASQITSGQFNTQRIPELSCSKITSGTFDPVRIPNLSANKITSGTLDANNVTVKNLSASSITTGTLSANRISGGTLSGCAIKIGSYFSITTTGVVTLGYIDDFKVYGYCSTRGWARYTGISDSIPYMNNTVDQWLLHVVSGIVVGYGNN